MSSTYKWIFIGEVPVLYETRRVARQLEIEMWLDPPSLLRAVNLKLVSQEKPEAPKYVA